MEKKYCQVFLILLLFAGLATVAFTADLSYNVSIRNWDIPLGVVQSPDVRINTSPVDDDYFYPGLAQDVALSKTANTIYVRFQSQCLYPIPDGCVTVTAYYSEAEPGLEPAELDVSGLTWYEIGNYVMDCQFPPDSSHTPGIDDNVFPGEWYPRSHEQGSPSLYSVVCSIDCDTVMPFAFYLKVQVALTCHTDEDPLDDIAYSYYDLLSTTPPVDVMLAIDCSGSMIDELPMVKDRAKYFIDLMNINDRVGVVAFSGCYPLNVKQVFGLQYINSLDESDPQHVAMRTQINNLSISSASCMTPMGSGVLFARDALTAIPPVPAENQAIVLLTDGKENISPDIKDPPAYPILHSLNTSDIALYPLWFGPSSDWGLSLLEDIAAEVDEYKLVDQPENNLKLAKSYLMIRGILTADDVFDIHEGISDDTYTSEIQIDSVTSELILTTAWQSMRRNLSIEVRTPGGKDWVDASALKPVILHGDAYIIYRFRKPSPGTWSYRLKHDKSKEPYILAALADKVEILMQSKLKKSAVKAGEPVTVYARLTQQKKPVLNAKIVAKIAVPEMSLGTVLLKHRNTIEKIAAVQGTDLSKGDMITMNLPAILGSESLVNYRYKTVELCDDGNHGDGASGDGLYAATINTAIAGTYRIVIEAKEGPASDVTFKRQHEHIAIVGLGRIHPGKSILKTELVRGDRDGFDLWKVTTTPVDIYGNACFPGYKDKITLSAKNGNWQGTLTDNQDGSYQQLLSLKKGEVPSIVVTAFGEQVGGVSASRQTTDTETSRELSIHALYYFYTETDFSGDVSNGPGIFFDLGFSPVPWLSILANYGIYISAHEPNDGIDNNTQYDAIHMFDLVLRANLNLSKFSLYAQAGPGIIFSPYKLIPFTKIGAGLHIPLYSPFILDIGADYMAIMYDFDLTEASHCIQVHTGCVIKW
ncbi:MAG: VWA domain-containing protein [Spirochaetales bacterium]|nr:VWA domain-containing protein [Spirochaetales bacterium]